MRPTAIFPQELIDELLRLYRIDRRWATIEMKDSGEHVEYICLPKYKTWLVNSCQRGADYLGMYSSSIWLGDGPKIFRPSPDLCQALENVDVNLSITDYSQPFPAVLIVLPPGRYGPFTSVLCYHEPGIFVASLFSADHENDIVTTVCERQKEIHMEESLRRFDQSFSVDDKNSPPALRVACNACLLLSSHPHTLSFLYPKEVETDQRLSREKTERGDRARKRLPLAVQQVSFDREVVFRRVESRPYDGKPTGASMPSHWRSGGWARQTHGPNNSLRKWILRPPVLVRADLFMGPISDTTTTYR